ncbi:hypothetical protein [Luteimonas salinilitoris]|uniref:Uncharacterized protein n=1 Tax=Luteimonas salinilitoris TaxID=3237697 RepID=A0ABV4HR10_9GAMM
MKRCVSSSVLRLAGLPAGILVALSSMTAAAQDAADPEERQATTLDRIEVTGTRIRQVDLETASGAATGERAVLGDGHVRLDANPHKASRRVSLVPSAETDPMVKAG